MLYHRYKLYQNGSYVQQYETSYPARSADNVPADKWIPSTGPLPDDATQNGRSGAEYDWGYMNSGYTGFQYDSTSSFSPGKWRLDPWSVSNGQQTRGEFEIHGGTGSHDFWTTPTHGCIRLPADSVTGLKTYWDGATDNKYDPAPTYIHY